MPDRHSPALAVTWEAPGGIIMVLDRREEQGGILNISIDDGAVMISSQNCRLAITDTATERKGKKPASQKKISEFRLTVPLARCQITWNYVE